MIIPPLGEHTKIKKDNSFNESGFQVVWRTQFACYKRYGYLDKDTAKFIGAEEKITREEYNNFNQ